MIRNPLLLAVALAATVLGGAHRANAASIPDNIAAAIADAGRPDAD